MTVTIDALIVGGGGNGKAGVSHYEDGELIKDGNGGGGGGGEVVEILGETSMAEGAEFDVVVGPISSQSVFYGRVAGGGYTPSSSAPNYGGNSQHFLGGSPNGKASSGGGAGDGANGHDGGGGHVGGGGGIGISSSISGTASYYGGGGGGWGDSEGGAGANGGGGNGADGNSTNGSNGTSNKGGGGGGCYYGKTPGVGGIGVVIIRYLTASYAILGTGGTITTVGLYTIHTFTVDGTFIAPRIDANSTSSSMASITPVGSLSIDITIDPLTKGASSTLTMSGSLMVSYPRPVHLIAPYVSSRLKAP